MPLHPPLTGAAVLWLLLLPACSTTPRPPAPGIPTAPEASAPRAAAASAAGQPAAAPNSPTPAPTTSTAQAPATFSPALACSRIAGAAGNSTPRLQQLTASSVPADAQGHPPHCLLQGRLKERAGADGRNYTTAFELRLPQAWNGRFLHQANGGTDGVVKPAFGDLAVLERDALARGFAVLSSNGGHDGADAGNARHGLVQGVVFGLDPQARLDYGHAAQESLYPLAQALIQRTYGRAPQRNYLAGCSNGGRQTLVAASRTPERYDGYLAGAPGLNLPRAALQHAWDVQSWRLAADDIRQAFSPADLQLVARHVVARCDGLDLLIDGQVADVRRCQPQLRLDSLRCNTHQTSGCLREAQIKALQRSLAGPRNRQGQALYSDWPLDTGIASAGWRAWKLETTVEAWDRLPIIATMGAGSLAYVFSTPPRPVVGTPQGLLDSLLAFDFDRDAPAITATAPPYAQSAVQFMNPPDIDRPQLAALRQRGAKVLVYHGASDPVFSLWESTRWIERAQAVMGQSGTAEVARLFAVPGMGHCQGGPATDRFDALGALVDWVENGRAPDRIDAQLNPASKDLPADWPTSRSRPLCPWPQVARYAGGPTESAASFRCSAP